MATGASPRSTSPLRSLTEQSGPTRSETRTILPATERASWSEKLVHDTSLFEKDCLDSVVLVPIDNSVPADSQAIEPGQPPRELFAIAAILGELREGAPYDLPMIGGVGS